MKTNEAKKKLREAGCHLVKEKTNHEWWYSPITKKSFPVPRHGAHELPDGTKQSIEKLSGVSL